MHELLIEIFTLKTLTTIGLSLLTALLAAFVKTRFFIDKLDQRVLNGVPNKLSNKDIALINTYLASEEIKINKVLTEQPNLSFQPYTDCSEVFNAIDQSKAKATHDELLKNSRPDDPHAFVYPKDDIEILQTGKEQELSAYAIGSYSEMKSLPKEQIHRILVLGANNLVIRPSTNEFILHRRGDVAETKSNYLHGFGGGYMPYWDGGKKSTEVRRDDCKSLKFNAMRELHEESGLLSLDHVPGLVCVIEERHRKNADLKFGYLTFFFVTLIHEQNHSTFKGDPKEGAKRLFTVNSKNINSMIINGKIDQISVHPQLRAMLLIWMFAGCPGLHYVRRRLLSNFYTRSKLRSSLISTQS